MWMVNEIVKTKPAPYTAICLIEVKMSKSKRRKSTIVVIDRQLIGFLTSKKTNQTKSGKTKLSKTGQNVFLLFLTKRQFEKVGRKGKEKWAIVNNGEIVFPYCEAKEKYGIPASTFSKAIDKLIEFGLIDINHHGGGMLKDMTTYYISERWRDYGTPAFKERSRQKDTRGLGFTPKNWEERSRKKRRGKSKSSNENAIRVSNKNVTALNDVPCASGNKNVTEEIDPNFFIYKGEELIRYFRLCSNENITIL